MDVYDFSAQASGRCIETVTDGEGRFQRAVRPKIQGYQLPWNALAIHFASGGHDSIVLLTVNTLHSHTRPEFDSSVVR